MATTHAPLTEEQLTDIKEAFEMYANDGVIST